MRKCRNQRGLSLTCGWLSEQSRWAFDSEIRLLDRSEVSSGCLNDHLPLYSQFLLVSICFKKNRLTVCFDWCSPSSPAILPSIKERYYHFPSLCAAA